MLPSSPEVFNRICNDLNQFEQKATNASPFQMEESEQLQNLIGFLVSSFILANAFAKNIPPLKQVADCVLAFFQANQTRYKHDIYSVLLKY